MRIFVLVALLSTVAAWLLDATAPPRPPTPAMVTALTLPAEALVGESLVVFGSMLVSSTSVIDRRFQVCHLESERCETTGWGTVIGPDHWHGYAGRVFARESGSFQVNWTLYAAWGTDASRVATRARAVVTVRAPAE